MVTVIKVKHVRFKEDHTDSIWRKNQPFSTLFMCLPHLEVNVKHVNRKRLDRYVSQLNINETRSLQYFYKLSIPMHNLNVWNKNVSNLSMLFSTVCKEEQQTN